MTTESSPESSTTLYFAYGSNLCLEQMGRRCPSNRCVGVARLDDWRWVISVRGYANVVPSPEDHVYGMVYELNEEDEDTLDHYEGVPRSYVKQIHEVDFFEFGERGKGLLHRVAAVRKDVLVYVDVKRLAEGPPKAEYITRINNGIEDAVTVGIPMEFFDKYFRPTIPAAE